MTIIWIICAIINVAVLYHFMIFKKEGDHVNYGWLAFYTFYAVVIGPVWTMGIVLYQLGVKNADV